MMESLGLAAIAYSLYRLAKLDCLLRIAATTGFACGAILEACNLGLAITIDLLTEWALAGFLVGAVIFQREIRQLLR